MKIQLNASETLSTGPAAAGSVITLTAGNADECFALVTMHRAVILDENAVAATPGDIGPGFATFVASRASDGISLSDAAPAAGVSAGTLLGRVRTGPLLGAISLVDDGGGRVALSGRNLVQGSTAFAPGVPVTITIAVGSVRRQITLYPASKRGAAILPPVPTPGKPGAPTLTGFLGDGRNTLLFSDDNTSGFAITSHNLYASFGEAAPVLVQNFATPSPYVDLGLTNGIKRNYQLTALNINGEGPPSNLVSFTPTAPTFAASYLNPRVGMWGSSRDRQSIGTSGSSGTNISKTFGGIMGWLEAKVPQLIYPIWPEPNPQFYNAGTSGSDGFSFANDGNNFNSMAGRRNKMIPTDADIFIGTQTSNSLQLKNPDGSNFSAPVYLQEMAATFAPILAVNKRVIVQAMWERASTNVNAPPQWNANAAARGQVEAIVAGGLAYAQNTPGVSFADIRSDIVDLSGTVHDPLPGYTRDGDAHFSAIGSWAGHKRVATELRKLIAPGGNAKGIDGYKIGNNLHPNPTFTGSVAISGVTGVTGNVPTGVTIARDASGTSNAVVTVSIVQVNGKNVIRITGDTTAMTAGQFEGLSFSISAQPASVAGKWYMGAGYAKPSVFDNWRNVGRIGIGSSGFTVAALTPINSGCTPLGSLGSGSPMILPSEDMGELCGVTPFGKASAASTISYSQSVWWGKGTTSQTFTIDLYGAEIFETIDPHLFMYDETNTTPAAITNATAPTFPGDGTSSPSIQLTATQPGYWSVLSVANGGGADAALWSVTSSGLAKRASSFDYANPNDADTDRVDQVTFVLTPFNTTMAPVTKLLNPTATYVDQGFRDDFNRANETLAASPNWTKVGAGTQSISVSSNKLNASGGSGQVAYLAPKQGDTTDQQAGIVVAASASLYHPVVTIAGKDEKNWVGMRFSTADKVILTQSVNGTVSGVIGFDMFAPYNAGGVSQFTANLINGVISVYQAGVLLGTVAYDMSAKTDWKLSGLAQYTSASATGGLDTFTSKVAVPIAAKVGMYKLDATTKTGTVGQDYASELTGRTQQDSDISISYTGGVAGVSFFADGQVLRGIAPPAGTYVLTLIETYPGAVLSGRQSTITVVIS